jgi:hypothetical protein
LATTAFVKAAVPAVATRAELLAGSDNTKVLSAQIFARQRGNASFRSLTPSVGMFTSTTTGSGAGSQVGIFYRQSYNTGVGTNSLSTKVGNGNVHQGLTLGSANTTTQTSAVNYSKLIMLGARCYLDIATTNNIIRTKFGHGYGAATTGDLNDKGFGIKVSNRGGVLLLMVHDGTTLNPVTSSFTPAQYEVFDWDIISESGTATLYVNGTSVASTSTNVPSGTLSSINIGWQQENVTVTSNTYTSAYNEFGGYYYVAP